MKATLREKPLDNNRISLYLDFYPPILNPNTGKYTRREFLKLYVFAKPKNEVEKQLNKETRLLARRVAALRQLKIQEEDYGFLKKKNKDYDILPFFKGLANKYRLKQSGDKNNWNAVYNFLHRYTKGVLLRKELTEQFVKNFKENIQTSTTFISKENKLANNTAVLYFSIFKKMVRIAYNEKLIDSNIAKEVSNIRTVDTKREFLTLEELKILYKAPCDSPLAKKAALFSALTGLRFSDVKKLTWQEVYHDELISFYSKSCKIEMDIESLFPVEILKYANEMGWLENRSKLFIETPNNWDYLETSALDFLKSKEISELQLLYTKKVKITRKEDLCKYASRLNNKSTTYKNFKDLLLDIIDYLIPK